MSHDVPKRACVAVVLAVAGFSAGCRGGGSTAPVVLTISSLSPAGGTPAGATVVSVFGQGFEEGATVTFGGIAADHVIFSSLSSSFSQLTVNTPAHAAGAVDVVVTNPGGASTTRAGAFTYALPPTLSITSVTPNRVSTIGGAFTDVHGVRFDPGAILTIDGVPVPTFVTTSIIVASNLPAHPAGTVDLVVTNPDGQKVTLAGGFTFAPPESFDFNGVWDGYPSDSDTLAFQFTIVNNRLTSLTCGTSTPYVPAPSPPVVNGAFLFAGADGATVSGRIVAAAQAIGAINFPVCGGLDWFAARHQ